MRDREWRSGNQHGGGARLIGMPLLTRVLALLLPLLLLSACGDDEPVATDDTSSTSDTAGDDDRDSIEGEYIATRVLDNGEPRQLVAGTTIRLTLRDGTIGAQAGCNSIGGDYAIVDGVLEVDALAMTEMGCDPPRHDQDQWLADFLSSGPAMGPVEEGFVLSTEATEITFVDRSVAEPDVDLVGTEWVVDTVLEGTGDDGSATTTGGDMGSFTFSEDGTVSGSDGCNDFGALAYEVDGEAIRFGDSAQTTDMACPEVDTDAFWRVFDGTVAWDIDAARLTLEHADGFGLSATAQT